MPTPQDPSQVKKAPKRTLRSASSAGNLRPDDTPPSRRFTNIPGKGAGWTYLSDFDKPRELTTEEKRKIRGTEDVGAPSIGMEFARGWEETPELGARPQGTWDYEAVKRTFPGMVDERVIKQEEWERAQNTLKEVRKDPRMQGAEDMPTIFDRDKFEESVFKAIGGNPFAMDPVAEMNASTKLLPQLFERAFGGKVAWADRGKLNKEQREAWNELKKQFRAHVYDTAKSKRQTAIDQYNMAMNRFDYYHKTQNSILAQRRAEQEKAEKAPEQRKARGADGLLHWQEYRNGKWVDTGQIATSIQEDEGLPADLRQMFTVYKQIAPKQDPMMVWALTMAMKGMKEDDPAREALQGVLTQSVMPGMEDRAKALLQAIGIRMDEYFKNFAKERGGTYEEKGGKEGAGETTTKRHGTYIPGKGVVVKEQ